MSPIAQVTVPELTYLERRGIRRKLRMSAELLCHPGNSADFQKGAGGATLALLSFLPSFVVGIMYAAHTIDTNALSYEITDFSIIAQTAALCFAAWSVYLMYDLHRSNGSLRRLLGWGGTIGGIMGILAFVSL